MSYRDEIFDRVISLKNEFGCNELSNILRALAIFRLSGYERNIVNELSKNVLSMKIIVFEL